MNTDWMALFLAAITGAAISWTFCSLWAVRMIDQARQHLREGTDPVTQQIEREAEWLREASSS